MSRLPEDRHTLVRKLYEESELTVAEIAILADVSESAIYQRARREQWQSARGPGVTPRRHKLRPPPPATPALQALAGPQGGAVEGPGSAACGMAGETARPGLPDVDRAETARRLWLAVDRHLDDLYRRGAPDSEIRAAQNFAALARTLETLVDVERGLRQDPEDHTGGRAGRKAPPVHEGPADIDEFRNEIAHRLEGLLAAHRAGDVAQGTEAGPPNAEAGHSNAEAGHPNAEAGPR